MTCVVFAHHAWTFAYCLGHQYILLTRHPGQNNRFRSRRRCLLLRITIKWRSNTRNVHTGFIRSYTLRVLKGWLLALWCKIWVGACLGPGFFFCRLPNYSASVNSQGFCQNEAGVVFALNFDIPYDSSQLLPSTRLSLSHSTVHTFPHYYNNIPFLLCYNTLTNHLEKLT